MERIHTIRQRASDIHSMNAQHQILELDLYIALRHNTSHTKSHKGTDMNIVKNMEAFFIAAIAVTAFTAYATADVAVPSKPLADQISNLEDGRIATVVVTAKRLSSAEKARLGS